MCCQQEAANRIKEYKMCLRLLHRKFAIPAIENKNINALIMNIKFE